MSLARRLIGEAAEPKDPKLGPPKSRERQTRTYTVTAREDHLDQLEEFFSWVNMTRGGHSGSAILSVDGDGAARVEIQRQDGKLKKPDDYKPKSTGGPEFQVCLDSLDKPLPVIVEHRPVDYHVCPHCRQEIFEKHTFIDGDFSSGQYLERHSECKGAILWPEQDLSEIADWLRPGVEEFRKKRQAFLRTL